MAVARVDEDRPKIIDGIAAALGAAIVKSDGDAAVLLPQSNQAVVRRVTQFDVGILADLYEGRQIEAAEAMPRNLDFGVQTLDFGTLHQQIETALAAIDIFEGTRGLGVQLPVVDLLHLPSAQFA